MAESSHNEFDKACTENSGRGLFGEFAGFLLNNKKWWLLPILLILLLFAVLVMLGGTGFAPFIYTLF